MEIKLIAVGKIRERSYAERCEEFTRRIAHDARLETVEIKDGDPQREGEKILGHLKNERGRIIVLDEAGRLYPSREFALKLERIPGRIVLIIGGAYGLSGEVKAAAHELIALSPMTFTHEMARMILLEQLYRAISIMKNRKYHH